LIISLPAYDFLNHAFPLVSIISGDEKVVKILKPLKPLSIIDIATGTGDLAICEVKLNPEKIVGIDISGNMIK